MQAPTPLPCLQPHLLTLQSSSPRPRKQSSPPLTVEDALSSPISYAAEDGIETCLNSRPLHQPILKHHHHRDIIIILIHRTNPNKRKSRAIDDEQRRNYRPLIKWHGHLPHLQHLLNIIIPHNLVIVTLQRRKNRLFLQIPNQHHRLRDYAKQRPCRSLPLIIH